MKRKHLFVLPCFIFALVMAGCGGSNLPPGVTTGVPPLTPVTRMPTSVVPAPPTVTVTKTVSPRPTMTAKTKTPSPAHCVQDGVDTYGWDTTADDSGSIYPMYAGPLAPPSSSTGPCFDKLVFTVNTFAGVEFDAKYVSVVTADGSGLPVTDIKGSKFIQLVIKAHMLRDDQGNPLYNAADYNMPDVQGYGNLRELRLVTPDYEGYTTFGIGVDTMTPFAVESHAIDGEMTNVVVYLTRPHR
jgi:hypothetical protein